MHARVSSTSRYTGITTENRSPAGGTSGRAARSRGACSVRNRPENSSSAPCSTARCTASNPILCANRASVRAVPMNPRASPTISGPSNNSASHPAMRSDQHCGFSGGSAGASSSIAKPIRQWSGNAARSSSRGRSATVVAISTPSRRSSIGSRTEGASRHITQPVHPAAPISSSTPRTVSRVSVVANATPSASARNASSGLA